MGAAAGPAPPRWFTLEFAVYFLARARQARFTHAATARNAQTDRRLRLPIYRQVVARAYVFLWRAGRELTLRYSPPGGVSRLPGVQPIGGGGGHVDLSDAQWRTFRGSLPLLCVVAVATSAAARLVRRAAAACAHDAARRAPNPTPLTGRALARQVHTLRPGASVAFHVIFGLVYVGASARVGQCRAPRRATLTQAFRTEGGSVPVRREGVPPAGAVRRQLRALQARGRHACRVRDAR